MQQKVGFVLAKNEIHKHGGEIPSGNAHERGGAGWAAGLSQARKLNEPK
jgi:hypothetical protein